MVEFPFGRSQRADEPQTSSVCKGLVIHKGENSGEDNNKK